MGEQANCAGCGESLHPADRFCPACGKSAQVLCGQCDAPISGGTRFCESCGTPVAGAAEQAHPAGDAPPAGGQPAAAQPSRPAAQPPRPAAQPPAAQPPAAQPPPPAAQPPPPAAQPPDLERPRRRWLLPVAAAVVALAVGATAFVVASVLGADDPEVQLSRDTAGTGDSEAQAAPVEEEPGEDDAEGADGDADGDADDSQGATGGANETASSEQDEAEGPDDQDHDPGPGRGDHGPTAEADAAALETYGVSPPIPSWIVVLDSLEVDEYSPADAGGLIEYYHEYGIDARLLLSDDYEPLNEGYWVVHLLPFDERDQAGEACEEVRHAAPQCYPREIDAPR